MPFRLAAASLGMRVIEQPTSTGWSYKEMLAHVAAWHELTARRLRTFRQTGDQTYPADAGGTDDFNARAAARAAGLTADEVFRELDRTRIELRDAVAALTDEQIGRDVQDTPWGPASWAVTVVAGNSYGHYDEHRDEIMGGVPRTAAGLIARVEQGWLPFRSTVESVGIRDLSRRTSSGWTAKGLLGHVTHWMEEVLPELSVRLRGERSTPPDVDAANAAASVAADALPAPEVLRKLDAAYEALLAALRALDPARELPFLAVRLVAGETYAHFVEHTPELRELWPRYPELGVDPTDLRTPETVRREDMAERGLDGW